MALGAARPAIRRWEPTGRSHQFATEAVVRAPPDGYTLLLVNSVNAINATLYDRLNFNFIRDIAPVAAISRYTS
jgi:tripartite-type tricarboxylate transporter receptor subunit TctC